MIAAGISQSSLSRRGSVAIMLLALLVEPAFAFGETAVTNAEIGRLMTSLRSSSCEFNRNGSWHASRDAHDHILKKLNYVRGRTTIPNAEYFIREVATRSSFSDKPYLVRCRGTPVRECHGWLMDELSRTRASASPPS